MTFGSIFGMYSSIFIGGPILIHFGLKPRSEAEDAAKEKAKTAKRSDGAVV